MNNTNGLSLFIPHSGVDRIEQMQKQMHGVTKEEVARRAFSLLSLALEAELEGKKLIIQGTDPEDKERIKVS